MFAFLLAYALYLLLPLRERGGIWMVAFYGFIYGSGAVVFLILRRSYRRQDDLLKFSLTGGRRSIRGKDDVSPAVRNYLEERAQILGSLVSRAASEIYLQQNEVPQGSQVIARQTQNALLRENALWDKLEPSEAELASAPDGCWTAAQQNEVVRWCEQLRLLRWTLGIDAELMPLEHFPKVDFNLALGLTRDLPSRPFSRPIRWPWDVRIERDVARNYSARVIAELRGRDLISSNAELDGWATHVREKFMGPSKDLLAGPLTIGELDDEALRLLGAIATIREQYVSYLVDQLSAEAPTSFSATLAGAFFLADGRAQRQEP